MAIPNRDQENIELLYRRIRAVGKRMGLTPYETIICLVTDDQMSANIIYGAMPSHHRAWWHGKQAMRPREGHVYEVVINSRPSYCFQSVTNSLSMHALVIAHAAEGHVDFFANNQLFKETDPDTVLHRFRRNASFVEELCGRSDWGIERVEHFLDAAHAIEFHIPSALCLPADQWDDGEEREKLEEYLRQLQAAVATSRMSRDVAALDEQITEVQNQLKRHPIYPTRDLLGFLAIADNTPHLTVEARELLRIVREQSLYFQPQIETKIMNEGWATFWHSELLKQPDVGLPLDIKLALCKHWTMFDGHPVQLFFNHPYALGERLWSYIDRTLCFDAGDEEVSYRELVYDDRTNSLSEKKRAVKERIARRDRSRMFDIRKNCAGDHSFLDQFMTREFLQDMASHALSWVCGSAQGSPGVMHLINQRLKRSDWGGTLVVQELPTSIEGLLDLLQRWMEMAANSEQWHADLGFPRFPVRMEVLEEMATILQIAAACDDNWRAIKGQMMQRTGLVSKPLIELLDTGLFADGVWTLQHHYDERQGGELLASEARDTLRLFRRLCGAPIRLLTRRSPTDQYGMPVDGAPALFEYICKESDGTTVHERQL